MTFNLSATLVFVLVTTFTPGPNNLLSASMGVTIGYRRTLPFLLGVTVGFLVVMALGATLSSSLATWFPAVASVTRYLGAAYILWLAVGVYRRSSLLLTPNADGTDLPSFWKGALLQFVNPKAIFYALTLYTAFLTPLLDRPLVVAGSPIVLSAITFAAISAWALGGHVVRGWISTPARARAVGIVFALALLYTALDVAGVFTL